MVVSALQIILDGDCSRVYGRGEKVSGRVILVVDEEQHIESLKLVFAGSCITKTSRPFHVNSNCDTGPSRRSFENKVHLFTLEQELEPETHLIPRKHFWPFEFTFPKLTQTRHKKLARGSNYLREPHSLPPSFQLVTAAPGGAAQISYFVQAKLAFCGSKANEQCKLSLRYQPLSETDASQEARVTSAALYGQIWKPTGKKDDPRRALNKVFLRGSKASGPRIMPSLSHPNQIVPNQHIPLLLTLVNTRDSVDESEGNCVLDSLSVIISTHSTIICGQNVTYPEDIVSKHVTCITKSDMNKPLSFGRTQALTSNFRLVDNGECVPSFRTYTMTRCYDLRISIGVKYNDQSFTIKFKTPIEILPQPPYLLPVPPPEEEEIDPLPLYAPRELELSSESAPAYESIFTLAEAVSSTSSFELSGSERSSPLSGASTPRSEGVELENEVDQVVWEESAIQPI